MLCAAVGTDIPNILNLSQIKSHGKKILLQENNVTHAFYQWHFFSFLTPSAPPNLSNNFSWCLASQHISSVRILSRKNDHFKLFSKEFFPSPKNLNGREVLLRGKTKIFLQWKRKNTQTKTKLLATLFYGAIFLRSIGCNFCLYL